MLSETVQTPFFNLLVGIITLEIGRPHTPPPFIGGPFSPRRKDFRLIDDSQSPAGGPQSASSPIAARALRAASAALKIRLHWSRAEVLYERCSKIDFVYFPHNCVLSAVTIMEDGNAIEVGTIGNEGRPD